MGDLGWLGAIIVGGLAGWIASIIMKVRTGLLLNIVLGILGAIILDWILTYGLHVVPWQNWLGQLVVGLIGACILIALLRAITGRK
ncbi:MAG: GlsB/YeaQ/YmgE family stress response membrane protein [Devosia sp.]|jgi:uncharacterized membrane protein YeaQ/YmgE (transglycosylase-associated protein family)